MPQHNEDTSLERGPFLQRVPGLLAAFCVIAGAALLLKLTAMAVGPAHPVDQAHVPFVGKLSNGDMSMAFVEPGADGGLMVAVFSDFECPACQVTVPQVVEMVRGSSGHASLAYFNYPLPTHPHARMAARAMIAASLQGKTWEMFDGLYRRPDLSRDGIWATAKSAGLDIKEFEHDLDSSETAAMLSLQVGVAVSHRIKATPTIVLRRPDGTSQVVSGLSDLRRALSE